MDMIGERDAFSKTYTRTFKLSQAVIINNIHKSFIRCDHPNPLAHLGVSRREKYLIFILFNFFVAAAAVGVKSASSWASCFVALVFHNIRAALERCRDSLQHIQT